MAPFPIFRRHIEMTYLKYFVQIEVSIKSEKEKTVLDRKPEALKTRIYP